MDTGWRSAKPRKKTQAEKRSEQRMRNSWFTQQYDAYGENFSNFKNAQDVKKESFRIFKSLADCAVDLDKHTKCFQDPIFLGVLKDVSYEKMVTHYTTQLGLEQMINFRLMNNQFVEGFLYENYSAHKRSAEAYTLLYQAFSNIQVTGDYVGELSKLMPLLNKYKFSL
jgi:hypothetical protein